MKLNTFDGDRPNFDGILAVCINGVECLFDKLVYVDQQANIEGIMFSTFFGGSDASWATPHDTFIYFRDFKVTKIK